MRLGSNWNRRTFLGSLIAVASSLLAPAKLFAKSPSAAEVKVSGFGQSGNPYEELGLKTVINCEGTMTVLGGSILRPELEAVMAQAGRHFVRIADLEVAAGNRISQMLKLPEGYTAAVTSGAAAAMESGFGWHPYRKQRTVHQTDSRSDRDEVGSDLPEIPSQSLRSSTAQHRNQAGRD